MLGMSPCRTNFGAGGSVAVIAGYGDKIGPHILRPCAGGFVLRPLSARFLINATELNAGILNVVLVLAGNHAGFASGTAGCIKMKSVLLFRHDKFFPMPD